MDRLKKRLLFIPAPIRSHVIPTLYLADLLKSEYDIYYAVNNQILADIIKKNGHTAIKIDHFPVAFGLEYSFLISRQRKAGFWHVLKSVYTNELLKHRQQILSKLILEINPNTIIIDIFTSTDFLILYSYCKKAKILFFNPMLSTYKIKNYPIVSEDRWPNISTETNQNKFTNIKKIIKNPYLKLYNTLISYQWNKLQKISAIPNVYRLIKTPISNLFTNVPEILLAPKQLEFSSEIGQRNQYYLGLCIRDDRVDTEIDPAFSNKWQKINKEKNLGEKLIYCSFGTFYSGSDIALLKFLENLIEAVKQIENIQLICSVNNLVIQTLKIKDDLPQNIHFFKRVPQLNVLKESDLHITHGGLGSVKESIYYEVPMLVYPLDLQYDQNGNGLKVEYHGLGLKGTFNNEFSDQMKIKIEHILGDKKFKNNIKYFKQRAQEETHIDDLIKLIM